LPAGERMLAATAAKSCLGTPQLLAIATARRLNAVPSLSKGSQGRGTAGTPGRSASPMLFPRIPRADIITAMTRSLWRAK
jgi:hypothetical protein